MQKILIIRFSSIGDIVLTSPVVRCLKLQQSAEIHYLTKKEYVSVLESSPYIDRIFTLTSPLKETLKKLKIQNYNLVIDLHNNWRSYWFKINLNVQSVNLEKKTFYRLLFIYLGVNLLNNHIVDRYFHAVKKLNIMNDQQGLDYFIHQNTHVDFNITNKFITWCIGASHDNKKLSKTQIIQVCNTLSLPVVLLGGLAEKIVANGIVTDSSNEHIYNFCGRLSLDQSAYLIQKSILVLTHDTGLMHIASALKKPILSFWGCTKPSQGFKPYMANDKSIELVANAKFKPCSKYGKKCRLTNLGCLKTLDVKLIKKSIKQLLLAIN